MRKMLWAEWKKLRRSSIIMITIFATVLIAVIVLVAGRETSVDGFYLSDAGWYMTMVQPWATMFVLPAIIAMLGSYMICREEQDDTLKSLLLILVSETALTAAKMIVTFILSVLIYLLLFVITLTTEMILHCSDLSVGMVLHFFKAIPHKERTAKRSGKRYNKEVKKQLTMSLISDELGQASTKKKEFLGIMEKLIPWSEWVGIVQPHYYKGERGNKPYDLELMLRIYVLQHLYNLADDAARNEIIDSRAFSQFCGVDSSNQVPDGDTIGRFRHILERNQLGEAFFTNVVESLQKCNLMLKKGTIVDSTLIAAPSSTKNKEKQRDPEAHSVKKGNQCA